MTRLLPVLLLLAAPAALAQEEEPRPGEHFVYQPVTHIDIEEVEVSATLVGPGGCIVVDRAKADFPPMIQIRRSFAPEMAASVGEVK